MIAELTPFAALRLDDRATQQTSWFTLHDLRDANRKAEAIGWILDHRPLMRLLLDHLEQSPRVALRFGVTDIDPHPLVSSASEQWLIAADGPRSSLRERSGIRHWSYRYQQGCLTAKVRLRGADPSTAYELFRPEGPMAVLPLGEDRYRWSGVRLSACAATVPAPTVPNSWQRSRPFSRRSFQPQNCWTSQVHSRLS